MLYLPRKLDLPHSLREMEYSVYDGRQGNTIVRIDSRRSRFRGDVISKVDQKARRKVENLIIMSNQFEKTKVVFD